MSLKEKTIPNHKYKITFGVNQTEKIEKKCNNENKSPVKFIKNATIDNANKTLKNNPKNDK